MDQPNSMLLPLTQSQYLLWAGQQMNPKSPLYNVPYSFHFKGHIDEKRFQRAFQNLIAHVDVLRIVFVDTEDGPRQQILPSLNHQLNTIAFHGGDAQNQAEEWMLAQSEKTFDLALPLFDSAIVKYADSGYFWYLNLHHLITDAASATILFNLMAGFYSATNDAPPTPGISYKEYLVYEAQQHALNSATQTYWKEKVKGLVGIPPLYGNKKTGVGSASLRKVLKLNQVTVQKLKKLATDPSVRGWTSDLSIFNILATTLFVYLYRVGGQKRLAIGAPVHNRTTPNFKNAPGLFIEMLPLAIELTENDTFRSVLSKVKLASNEFLRYAETGVSSAEVSRSFNAVLNFINTKFSDFAGLPVKTTWIHPGHCDPSHHLRCHVYDMDNTGEMDLVFDMNAHIFSERTRAHLPNHFKNLLDAAMENLELPIAKPSLLEADEISGLELLGTHVAYPEISVLGLFEQHAEKRTVEIAVEQADRQMTYGELNQHANRLAHFLKQTGLAPGSRVALYLYRSTDYIIALLASLKAGCTFIPIAADQPKSRLRFILENSNCDRVITLGNLKQNLEEGTEYFDMQEDWHMVIDLPVHNENTHTNPSDPAYILYTSGSTGNPKGVLVSHGSLKNYLFWAKDFYGIDQTSVFPLFTSIGFDLTISSTFLPLMAGGKAIVYKEAEKGPDVALFQVLGANAVNTIKLTPSHLQFIKGRNMASSKIRTMIVGGEDFKTDLAKSIQHDLGDKLKIYNEYGPTEATVGCIVSEYSIDRHKGPSVPIGHPIYNVQAHILDTYMNPVPQGVVGELYIAGASLADGYLNLPGLTDEKYVQNPFSSTSKMYHTGDLARLNDDGELEYLGRVDEQVKLRGFRIELTDIEANLTTHENVDNCAVVLLKNDNKVPEDEVVNCMECGLPSNYPASDFDEKGVCHLCNAFKGYKNKTDRYFKKEEELKALLNSKKGMNPHYDCLTLLSGGKDSTYILAQLVDMGLKVLAFTFDNGYISDQAKANIDRVVSKLGVDHVYGSTQHMNKIFVDSLHRHQNVCNGCFKVIYTLSTQLALDKQIPFVVTGLSRGQFFETRLTEELFWDEDVDTTTIDKIILEARKLYHQEEDAVKTFLDVSMFNHEDTFNKVQFVDFYRYSDVSLSEMLKFLKEKIDWVRPTDTGRSTNCLINQVGIHVHKKKKGYSNYSFPYSWDVRLGHKTRTETLDEINEVIDENEVRRIMDEIGYYEPLEETNQERLVGYYTGSKKTPSRELREHLKKQLPDYMVPGYFKYMDELPLTPNGKVDKAALKSLNISQLEMDTPFVAPKGEIEELLASIWKEVLRLKQVGVHDDFIALGGHSLAAIRVTARINEMVEMKFPLNKVFEFPTIAEYATYIEHTLTELMQE